MSKSKESHTIWSYIAAILTIVTGFIFFGGHLVLGFILSALTIVVYSLALYLFLQDKYGDRRKYASILIAVLSLATLICYFPKPPEEQTENPKLRMDKISILDDPVYQARILLVFNRVIHLDSLRNSEVHFALKGINGQLQLRVKIINASEAQKTFPVSTVGNRPIPGWFTNITQVTNNSVSTYLHRLTNISSDTLYVEITFNAAQQMPFRILRDFHGMLFTPYFPQNIVPLLKEIWLVADQQTIIKCRAEKVYWTDIKLINDTTVLDLKMPVASDPHVLGGGKHPDELWQIDIHKSQ